MSHFAATARRQKPILHSKHRVKELCIPNFITISLHLSVGEAIRVIRQSARHGIFYIYVVDEQKRLSGVVSVRNLLVSSDEQKVSDIYAKGVVSVSEDMAIEEAYRIFSRDRFLSLPVTNADGQIIGVLHAHELIDEYEKDLEELFQERSRGELFELLGIKSEPVGSPIALAWSRLPWLLINLLGGAISAFFIHDLASGLQDAVLYLAFVPILLIITESMGMQTMSIVIGHLHRVAKRPRLRHLFAREATVALLLAVGCSLCIAGPVYLWKGSLALSLSITLTILVGFLSACTLGHVFPALFHRMKVDPQIAAGPVVLAIADASTLVLYLLIALGISRFF